MKTEVVIKECRCGKINEIRTEKSICECGAVTTVIGYNLSK